MKALQNLATPGSEELHVVPDLNLFQAFKRPQQWHPRAWIPKGLEFPQEEFEVQIPRFLILFPGNIQSRCVHV